jgi:hypothetical protein
VLATAPSAVAIGEAAGLERVRAVEWPAARLLARHIRLLACTRLKKGVPAPPSGVLSAIPPLPLPCCTFATLLLALKHPALLSWRLVGSLVRLMCTRVRELCYRLAR